MDINGTRFHLLLGKQDWLSSVIIKSGTPPETDLVWDETYSSLTLRQLPFQFPSVPGDLLMNPDYRRGAAQDAYGNWYWIDKSGTELRFLAKFRKQPEHFWSAVDLNRICRNETGGFQPVEKRTPSIMKLCGLAVTSNHYLVVGVIEPAGILIFDLYSAASPLQIQWPQEVPFKPFDMASASDGGVWILDKDNLRYWKLDRYLEEEKSYPFNGSQPVAIEELPDRSVLIMDSGAAFPVVYRFLEGKPIGSVPLDIPEMRKNKAGYDMAFLPDSDSMEDNVSGTLYAVCQDGNQAYAFDLRENEGVFSLKLIPKYFPMRLFSGKGLIASDGIVYYDLEDRWLPITEQRRTRFREEGVLETRTFDGKENDCVWHRLFLDACIPPGAEVLVESKAANQEGLLAQIPWQTEPQIYLRRDGAEIPYYQAFSSEKEKRDITGTWELLFQSAHGRYLKLRLTLRGTGRNTPSLQALRIYYPRFSYLKEYLPKVYQEDDISVSFLDRFLSNMEGMYTVLEGRIAHIDVLFDIRTTEYFEWLAGWFGIMLDPSWDETRNKLFLSHAMQLFSERGTMPGLIRTIRLSIDPCPDDTLFEEDMNESNGAPARWVNSVRIVERYLTRSAPGVVFGDPSEIEEPGTIIDLNGWTPAAGAEPIHNSYRKFLEESYERIDELNNAWGTQIEKFDDILFPPVLPVKKAIADDWRRFILHGLGFTYAIVQPEDEPAYQAFLSYRYQRIDQLQQYYPTLKTFADIRLPGELPENGIELNDWTEFVSKVLPTSRSAHRFTVLIPVMKDRDSQERQVELVKRIIELEKPTHTEFDVRLYWALFRIGEARLGLDTVLDSGSGYMAMILGRSCLHDSFLAYTHPWDIKDRMVIERDKIDP